MRVAPPTVRRGGRAPHVAAPAVIALALVALSACSSSTGSGSPDTSTDPRPDATEGSLQDPARSDAEDLPLRPDALRTPDAAFAGLPGWNYEPRYAEVQGYRMAYVDEGPTDASPVLMMHGVPTWGYLYRTMMPVIAGAGHRVIVPDLIGFGRSDKPMAADAHSYEFHVDAISEFIREEDLTDITLVCQDWGSLIGLRVAAENPERFARIVLSNGGLPVGGSEDLNQINDAFTGWRDLVAMMSERGDMPVEQMMARQFGPDIGAAYGAPFPDKSFKAGPLALPLLVPVTDDDPANPDQLRAWQVFSTWEKPFLTAFGDSDPITHGADQDFLERVPGTQGQPHTTIEGASHFIQETHGPQLAAIVNDFIASTS